LTGQGGDYARGIYNLQIGSKLEATGIAALGAGSQSSYGLENSSGASAILYGGAFTGRGGDQAYGIRNRGSGTTLEASSVTALARDGATRSLGLQNLEGARSTLLWGTFTGRGGTEATGLANRDSGTVLEATSITASGEDSSQYSRGLYSHLAAETSLNGGVFTGRGGAYARGIVNRDTNTILRATSIAALGEDATDENAGLYNWLSGVAMIDSSQLRGATYALDHGGGTVRVGVTQLDGGANGSSGTLTCFQVYDESYAAYTCP
jgi:hypothetical protein